MAVKKSGTKAIRYTDAKKRQVLDFVDKVNAKKGRGGIAAAEKKYKISRLTIYRWKNALEGGTTGVSSGGTKKAAKKAGKKKAAKKKAAKKGTKKKASTKKAGKKVAKKATKKKAGKKKAGKKKKK